MMLIAQLNSASVVRLDVRSVLVRTLMSSRFKASFVSWISAVILNSGMG